MSPTIGTSSRSCLGVERLGPEPLLGRDPGVRPVERELILRQRHLDPVRRVLRGVPEERVHLGPEPLLLDAERAVDVGRAAAVPPRGLPPDDARLEDEDVDPRAGEPPGGAEPGDAAADDHDAGAAELRHASRLSDAAPPHHSTGIPPGTSSMTVMSGSPAQCGANWVGIPNQLTQCSRIDTGSSWGHRTDRGSGRTGGR